MAVSDDELNRFFELTSDTLRREGVDWLLEQVLEQIRLGKPGTLKVKEFQTKPGGQRVLLGEEPLSKGPFREFRTTEQYTPQERVNLLLDAIAELFTAVPGMEDAVSARFPGARFVEDPDRNAIFATKTSALSQRESHRKFKELIDRLREEVGTDANQQ